MIFTNYGTVTAGLTSVPVLRRFDFFQPVELADLFETLINKLPGALAFGINFAAVFSRATAWAVEHVFGTASDRADAAVFVEYARAAGGAFFRPDASFLEYADEGRIEARVNWLIGVTFGEGLNTGAATKRKNRVISLYGIGRLFKEDVVALTLYGQLLDFKGQTFQLRGH